MGPHDLPRLPRPHRVRTGRVRRDRSLLPRTRHRVVRLVLGPAVGRLHRAVRAAVLQGRVGVAHRRRAARPPRGHGPTADPVDRHVDDGRDPRRGRCPSDGPPAARAQHQHVPVQARRAEPAHDRRRCSDEFALPDRLLRSRGRPADHGRRGRARRRVRRAPHHARPRHVGQRPGRVDRAGRRAPARPRHPRRSRRRWATASSSVYDSELPSRARLRRSG